MYTLRAEGGPQIGQSYPVNGSVTLGREAGNAITLADNQLSRRHARFDASPGGLTVTDLGSANGVYVNGQRVNGSAVLRPGDTVGAGSSLFRVEADAALDFAPPQQFSALSSPAPIPHDGVPIPPAAPMAAQRRALPIPLLVAAGLLLLVVCAGSGAMVAFLATRGDDDAKPTAVAANGTAVPAAGGAGSSAVPAASVASSTKRQAGMVTGRITTSTGQSLPAGATASVTINGTSIAGERVSYNPSVDAQGRYSQRVADGLYAVTASVNFRYNGGTFNLTLHPNDDKPYRQTYDSKDGIVKDFTWKLSGLVFSTYDTADPLSYYGQYLTLIADSLKLSADSSIEFTFTPRGPLADGSTGQPIKRTVKGSETTNWGYLSDIPIGPYTVTANVTGSQPRALKICIAGLYTNCTQDPTKASTQFQFDFKPSASIGGIAAEPLYLVAEE